MLDSAKLHHPVLPPGEAVVDGRLTGAAALNKLSGSVCWSHHLRLGTPVTRFKYLDLILLGKLLPTEPGARTA